MKKSIQLAAAAASAALILAACGAAPEATTTDTSTATNTTETTTSTIKACMVSDEGGFEDKSFNESGKMGMEQAKAELGIEVAYSESSSGEDYGPNIAAQIQQGCNIIIGVGFLMADAMNEAAVANPNVKFALVDSGFADSPENSKALVFNTAEASFLAGYAAAGMTSTGKVGTFLGMNIPSTAIFADGFQDGIKKYNEVKGTNVELLGWDKEKQDGMAVGNFSDTPKGKQFSTQLIEQGADIILPVAGPVGEGALAAAQETGKASVIWVDADGYETKPDFGSLIMTSVMKEIDNAVFDTIKSLVEDSWSSDPYVGTVANGGVSLAPFHDFEDKVPAELKAEIEQLSKEIADGTLVVESIHNPSNS
ncbi:BMP family lipoprotein [Schaalia suimastitidis]|uniref:BMP family lipoprotein n=1 Tax=Schaalia suimastitidis TaxID=121163 RepID=UPI0004221BAF|nr:BMP family ABC transporter substrate-binding protein [Schaalia suimastitidis]